MDVDEIVVYRNAPGNAPPYWTGYAKKDGIIVGDSTIDGKTSGEALRDLRLRFTAAWETVLK